MPLLFLLLEKVVNLEVGLVDRLEGQTEVGLVDRLFVDGLVEDLAVDFLVFLEGVFLEDLMVDPVVQPFVVVRAVVGLLVSVKSAAWLLVVAVVPSRNVRDPKFGCV